MLECKLKLAPYVIKKYEENLERFCFYNAKDKTFWDGDLALGLTVSALDGTISVKEVLDILSKNNDINQEELKNSLLDVFNLLLLEGFLVEAI